ncbi:MAG: MBL fold metallo-hydrolase [Rhizobiales bacterium]|nr:MBL fold metallo-hydrolase [Hyphomicrobiales bacterium]
MTNWQIGDVKISRLVEIEAALPLGGEGSMVEAAYPEALQKIDWLQPHFATPEGHAKIAIQAFLIETPTKRLIIDTCVGNDKKRDNPFFNNLQTTFLKDLEEMGWTRDSVDIVLCTHLHVDHVGWNTMLENDKWVPTFPKADYLIGQREWDFWKAEESETAAPLLADSVQPIFDAGLATLITDDHRICPEIHVEPTQGHTPGHISIVIESKGERAIITGDMIHHPCQMAHSDWRCGFDHNSDMANETRKSFLESVADQPTLVIGTHFATPAAGHVKRDGDGFRLDVA